MNQHLLGNPKLTVTNVNEVKAGINHIVVDSVQYGNQEMIMEKDVTVEMRDGEKLYINIFRPNKDGKFPVVMSADTYGKDNKPKITNMGALWPTLGAIPTSSFTPEESPDPGFWVPNDYVVVKVALRGSDKSKGVLSPWSKREAEDYYEVIEWAANQSWSNGNIGTNGVSYLAVTQWWVASLNPPHLKAMIPWEGLNDMYREVAFHGGIPDTGFYRFWTQGIFARWTDNPNIEDLIQAQQEHPLFDDFWKQRQVPLSQIKTPLLTCASGLHKVCTTVALLKDLNKLHQKKNGYMCMDVKSGKVTTLEKISNAKNHSLIFTLKKKITIGKIRLMSFMKLEINFIKANSNQRQRSLYLTQNIHHCI